MATKIKLFKAIAKHRTFKKIGDFMVKAGFYGLALASYRESMDRQRYVELLCYRGILSGK
jgi:hypothetical protein